MSNSASEQQSSPPLPAIKRERIATAVSAHPGVGISLKAALGHLDAVIASHMPEWDIAVEGTTTTSSLPPLVALYWPHGCLEYKGECNDQIAAYVCEFFKTLSAARCIVRVPSWAVVTVPSATWAYRRTGFLTYTCWGALSVEAATHLGRDHATRLLDRVATQGPPLLPGTRKTNLPALVNPMLDIERSAIQGTVWAPVRVLRDPGGGRKEAEKEV